ncbi:MAG: lipoprotein-anchoring transpeptidase ErfK/SrfK [Granulosicoccus sp.]|jgi:lipoprotein-anchoring transpeptidase ErfK/SrfK
MRPARSNVSLRHFFIIVLLSFSASTVSAAPHHSLNSSDALDEQIKATLVALAAGEIREARVLARQMAWRFPKYALAQLLSAELESTAAFQDVRAADLNPISQELIDLLSEAQARLKSAQKNDKVNDGIGLQELSILPNTIVQVGTNLSSLLIIDLEQSTINHIVGNDQSPTLIREHYIGSGKGGFGKQLEGDNKTPLGVYTITGKRADSSLPDLYGSGAMTLNYPNALDKHLGRTGYGIWIHGVPHAQRSRAPRSSEGCVTMSNDHMTSLMSQITPSDTLVILTQGLSYTTDSKRTDRQQQYQRLFTHFQQTLLNGDESQIAELYDNPKERPTQRQTTSRLGYVADINARDIAIVMNPTLPVEYRRFESRFLVMKAEFGPKNEHQVTLYWRELESGEWRITTEVWNNPNT